MTEPTVQVPVSLIERIAASSIENPDEDALIELSHLLSQPTPSAELPLVDLAVDDVVIATVPDPYPEGRYGGPSVQSGILPHAAPANPPRIEDMAPGTTFWARTQGGSLSHADRFWIVTDSGYVFSTGAHHLMSNRIDPSTIRDLTPPKEQP